jgi:hypothetical protein
MWCCQSASWYTLLLAITSMLSDIQEFYQFVNGIRAEGGQDEAEDVFGGLEAALKLNWQKVGTKVGIINPRRMREGYSSRSVCM